MESFDPQQQPLTINDDVEIVIDNDQQSLQQQRQQSIRSHSQQSTILKTGYNLPSTPIIQQQQQQSGIINRKSLQKRPTPPLPVELIRPPIVNQHLEELITSMFYIFILLFQKKNQCFFPLHFDYLIKSIHYCIASSGERFRRKTKSIKFCQMKE